MSKAGDVPCGPCHACCKTDVALLPEEGDKIEEYDHVWITLPDGPPDGPRSTTLAFLRKQPNGECVYLGRDGCTIHGRAPHICKIFDCRVFFLSHNRAERHNMSKHNPESRKILNAGRERMKTLEMGNVSRDRLRDHWTS